VESADVRQHLTARQRLLVLDTWVRSKLPAREFADLFGLSAHTLYAWKKRFDEEGPAGLEAAPRGAPRGSRMSETTKRAILLMKSQHPEWGQDRLHAMIDRTEGLSASPGAIARVLSENGYKVVEEPTQPHEPKEQRLYSTGPNELWQTDLFTFILKRENRRVWMVAFMDDHSRFIVGYGIYASSSGALVREVLEAAIANFGAPQKVLTDNGPQYKTWHGKSAFTELLERRGIKQIVARPRHPQTLGKIERFWATLWRELLQPAIFQGLEDARKRVGLFIDHYNFQRTHTGIDGLVPADRYFAASEAVRKTLQARVAANAAELARHGTPRKSFYLTGRVGDQTIALHASGSRVVLTREDGTREEVDLSHLGQRAEPGVDTTLPEPVAICGPASGLVGAEVEPHEQETPAPGSSPLDGALEILASGLERDDAKGAVSPGAGESASGDEDDDAEGAAGVLVRT
jgi:transposase InsO family protein